MRATKGITNSVGLGYVRVDEDFLGITSVRLIGGAIEVRARRYGPAPAVAGAYRLFSHDGEPVTDPASGGVGSVSIPALKAGQVFDFRVVLHMDHIAGGDATITWATE